MKGIESDVLIIGGGLTGLTLAYLLRDKGLKVLIVEARERLGGRIDTKYDEHLPAREMGATWLGAKHTALNELLNTLNLEIFEQELGTTAIYEPISTSPHQLVSLPPNTDPSYRIKGGSSHLINTLHAYLDPEQILTHRIVKSIQMEPDGISVKTATQTFKATFVVSTLPPNLLTQTIEFDPPLPNSLLEIARQTHTWMGESIKIALSYPTPFWKEMGSSGTIVSNVGPIPEMYDHSNVEHSLFALKGFLNNTYYSLSKVERLALILRQLRKYYGDKVENYLSYEETVWQHEPFTYAPYQSHVLPHQYNGHAIYRNTFWEGKFLVAGSETATHFPGYMEGAVRSAQFAYQKAEEVFQ